MNHPKLPHGAYRSAEVAKILGVSARTFYRMLADGRIEEPMRNPANGYRIWTEYDIRSIQAAWQEISRK